jgi:D-alanyl-D-alanine carboxypeptidase-like protein
MWPADNQTELEGFFSKHDLLADGRPAPSWEKANLVTVTTPYALTLAWDLAIQVKRITCHRLVAASLLTVLEGILSHYGTVKDVKTARMHLYGGCYNFRRISGSSRLSTHSWGAGIDLDPDRNPLGTPYSEQLGMMPLAVVALFEQEGWKWGGRFETRPDCMHFQATR